MNMNDLSIYVLKAYLQTWLFQLKNPSCMNFCEEAEAWASLDIPTGQ